MFLSKLHWFSLGRPLPSAVTRGVGIEAPEAAVLSRLETSELASRLEAQGKGFL